MRKQPPHLFCSPHLIIPFSTSVGTRSLYIIAWNNDPQPPKPWRVVKQRLARVAETSVGFVGEEVWEEGGEEVDVFFYFLFLVLGFLFLFVLVLGWMCVGGAWVGFGFGGEGEGFDAGLEHDDFGLGR